MVASYLFVLVVDVTALFDEVRLPHHLHSFLL